MTPWTAVHQAPLSMRFSRQGYWSGLPFSSPVWKGEANRRLLSSKAFTFLLFSELDSQAELTRFSYGLQHPVGRKTSTFSVTAAERAKEGGLEAPIPVRLTTAAKPPLFPLPQVASTTGCPPGKSLGRHAPLLQQGFLSFMHLSLNECRVILSTK